MFRTFVGALAVLASAGAMAQAQPSVSPEKLALAKRVAAKMPMENVGLGMLRKPVVEALRQAQVVIDNRVPADKQKAAIADVTADANHFLEEETPVVKASTKSVVDNRVVPLLAQRFTEDELKQLIMILESPVKAKFEAMAPEIEKTLGEGVAKANQAQINPKLTELQNKIGLRLRAAVQ
ncbi:MAG: DUF2059 domain-containing protein [Telluria sp.]